MFCGVKKMVGYIKVLPMILKGEFRNIILDILVPQELFVPGNSSTLKIIQPSKQPGSGNCFLKQVKGELF